MKTKEMKVKVDVKTRVIVKQEMKVKEKVKGKVKEVKVQEKVKRKMNVEEKYFAKNFYLGIQTVRSYFFKKPKKIFLKFVKSLVISLENKQKNSYNGM